MAAYALHVTHPYISGLDSTPFRVLASVEPPRLNVKDSQTPSESPPLDSQPVLPLIAPSPLMPYINVGVPILSGKCPLNFSNAENVLTTTAIDCWGSLAPYLANVVCCPQLDATIKILVGQYSVSSGTLGINETHAKDCLADISQILEAQGSNENLLKICKIHPSSITRASCPVVNVTEIEKTINIPKIIKSCEKIDPVEECRHKVCQSSIMDAAVKIASKNLDMPDMVGASIPNVRLAMIDDCKKIVLRWLASKLDPTSASLALRGISSCRVNKVCPLVFPDVRNVSKECGNIVGNQKACCEAMGSYITLLQEQSFITNLQAFTCAASLGANLQKANVTANLYDICRIKLKDFSLQVGSQDSGCLFPSLPIDVIYDESSGIGFKCDLNDNVAAPWPSANAYSPAPSTDISTELPALPKAASDQRGLRSTLFISTLLIVILFLILLNLKSWNLRNVVIITGSTGVGDQRCVY
uniref:uncharacterized GPI-anchored protein At1g61900-like n=1 Tax=Erigeron canadensis TaxID=72917 RepID=UPI001CB926F2|nr:uncharacterized GPI-anchored protein At1g61900-like [Erigeron canadensis]